MPNEEKRRVHGQLNQLIGDWRTMANSKLLQTYDRGTANGLRKAANDLEEVLKEYECPAARCSNCGTILKYGFCFNSSCKIDENCKMGEGNRTMNDCKQLGLAPDEYVRFRLACKQIALENRTNFQYVYRLAFLSKIHAGPFYGVVQERMFVIQEGGDEVCAQMVAVAAAALARVVQRGGR